jgi:eukaryotic-like serine/threonine-protein kinase
MDDSNFRLPQEQWAVLRRLLDEALDLPAEARDGWLARLPTEEALFEPRLRALLAHAEASDDFLAQALPPVETRNFAPRPPGAEHGGEMVGPYRLLRPLGEGGMASVWLAERADWPKERRVALKLPHHVWRRAGLLERFARERAILAGLEHPNIARLYDAGMTVEGEPYLALEYVEGPPIDRYCRGPDGTANIDVAERVRLFLQVARAVAYAHGKLVLHRDLKPANILVAPDGSVRLLDFGIAKLLEDGQARETQLTQVAGRAMSAAYASPEQIHGEPLSVTSDIYSLGVVLYELLTGARPRALKRNARGQIEDAMLFDDPARPSDRAEPADRRALRGDLDTIVLKALKQTPAERYQTAFALIDDLERALDGRPVSARPATLHYRVGTFVRRHRLSVTAGALLLATLIAGTVGTTVGMLRARDAEAAARTEAATAARYSSFLVDMFETAEPGGSKGQELSARDILQRGATRVRTELANEPLLQARLLATIGWVYSRQGLLSEAHPLLDEAVALARTSGTQGEADLARALIRRGENGRKLNRPDVAEADDREALSILERLHGPDDVRVVPALTELGLVLRMSDPDQALSIYRRSHALLVAAYGEAHGDAAVLLGNIGSMHRRARRYQEAKEAYEQAFPHIKQHYGERDPHVGTVLSNLSAVYRSLGDYAGAAHLAQQALLVHQAVSDPDHPDVGLDLQVLALSTDKLGNTRLALDQMDRALAILERRLPSGHPYTLAAANDKAALLIELGRFDEARKTLEDRVTTKSGGIDTRRAVLNGLVLLSEIERLENRGPQAEALANGVLADAAVQGDRFLETDARWARADALAVQGKRDLAEAERQHALALEATSAQQPNFPGALSRVKYHVCAGEEDQALAILRQAIDQGLRDPIVLHDPAFAPLRKRVEFAAIASAIAEPAAALRSANR